MSKFQDVKRSTLYTKTETVVRAPLITFLKHIYASHLQRSTGAAAGYVKIFKTFDVRFWILDFKKSDVHKTCLRFSKFPIRICFEWLLVGT